MWPGEARERGRERRLCYGDARNDAHHSFAAAAHAKISLVSPVRRRYQLAQVDTGPLQNWQIIYSAQCLQATADHWPGATATVQLKGWPDGHGMNRSLHYATTRQAEREREGEGERDRSSSRGLD